MQRADRVTRIVFVTAGLSATGGLVGAGCAAAAVAIIAVLNGGFRALITGTTPAFLAVCAGFGAVAGLLGAPVLAWSVLRRVPLGRAILVTALGTIVGAVVGQLARPINPYSRSIPGVIVGAFVGFLVAGIGLRIRGRQARTDAVRDAV